MAGEWEELRRQSKAMRRKKGKDRFIQQPTMSELAVIRILQQKGVARLVVGDPNRAEYTKWRLGQILVCHKCRDGISIVSRDNSIILWMKDKYEQRRRLTTEIEEKAYLDENTVISSTWSKKGYEDYSSKLNSITGEHNSTNSNRPATTEELKEIGRITKQWMAGEITTEEYDSAIDAINESTGNTDIITEVSMPATPTPTEDFTPGFKQSMIDYIKSRLDNGTITQEKYDELIAPYI